MKQLLKIFFILLKANFKIVLLYRVNLFSGIVSTLLWILLAVISISILTYQAPSVGGWNRYELFVVQGLYSIILGLHYVLFSENIKNLSHLVRYGNFDFVLIKPVDSQFLVSIGQFRIYQIARVVAGILLILYAVNLLQIKLSLISLGLGTIFVLLGLMVIYSIWFMIMTLSFWLVDLFNIYDLIVQLTGVCRYPLEIVRHVSKYLLYILFPLVVVTTVPAQIILNRVNLSYIVMGFITALCLLIISRRFWYFALKYYTSASS